MNLTGFDSSALRRQAEALLRTRTLAPPPSFDPIRLSHELQVHQIELEAQNHELVAANRDLDQVRATYQALYEFAPVGYITLSLAGRVLECNAKALELFGQPPDGDLNHSMGSFFDEDSKVAFEALFQRACAQSGQEVSEAFMLRRGKPFSTYVRVQACTVRLPHDSSDVVLLTMMDISALKYAEVV